MQYTITFLASQPKRDLYTDNLDCRFKFSVADSSLIGTPRESESFHTLKVVMTDRLMANWKLPGALDVSVVTNDMVKVAFQSAEEYIAEQLKTGPLQENELSSLMMTTENSPDSCPYKLANIRYPDKTTFTVDIADQDNDLKSFNIHPNILVLLNRMDSALSRDDYSGVLHASASVFETMAKDVIGIATVQDQTLKSFFERYRKDSILPNEVLDYILSIYESRNTTPLAGHGSTQTPNIARETAIALSEMTKAFVKIEYKLRKR